MKIEDILTHIGNGILLSLVLGIIMLSGIAMFFFMFCFDVSKTIYIMKDVFPFIRGIMGILFIGGLFIPIKGDEEKETEKK